MKKILFVEDNEMLLELGGMMLEAERDQWETTLAPNGQSALKLLAETAFDVVASDYYMPGMTGVELLTEVRRLYPQTSRIIISGLADQAETAELLNSTHLFIPKPFDAKILHTTLTRIGNLDTYLKDEKLRALAGKMGSLPSFPTLYLDILREVESPNSSIQGIAKIIAKDPGLTAKILQVANSAASGLTERISDPIEAVQQLGISTVRSLALSAQVYDKFASGSLKNFSAETLWTHLMQCGNLARAILCLEGAEFSESEDAFTAGLLHDMGKLMLAASLPDQFALAITLAQDEKISFTQAEEQIFGATHAGLAAYLFGLWGLPAGIVEAVAFHHTPEKSNFKKCSTLTAVHVANGLCGSGGEKSLNREYLCELGITDRLEEWRELAAEIND